MNTLISIRSNVIYGKKPKQKQGDPDEFKKFVEIILLCDKAEYEVNNESQIIRKRGVEQLRFTCSAESLKTAAAQLIAFADASDEEVAKMEKE